jgi:hypothetical protein
VAVTQSVEFARGLRATEFVFFGMQIYGVTGTTIRAVQCRLSGGHRINTSQSVDMEAILTKVTEALTGQVMACSPLTVCRQTNSPADNHGPVSDNFCSPPSPSLPSEVSGTMNCS